MEDGQAHYYYGVAHTIVIQYRLLLIRPLTVGQCSFAGIARWPISRWLHVLQRAGLLRVYCTRIQTHSIKLITQALNLCVFHNYKLYTINCTCVFCHTIINYCAAFLDCWVPQNLCYLPVPAMRPQSWRSVYCIFIGKIVDQTNGGRGGNLDVAGYQYHDNWTFTFAFFISFIQGLYKRDKKSEQNFIGQKIVFLRQWVALQEWLTIILCTKTFAVLSSSFFNPSHLIGILICLLRMSSAH